MPLTDDDLFLLSYYRNSEIGGSLFFGRLARVLKASPIQHDLTKHFADEAQHAWYWTRCIDRLGARPISTTDAYQDRYLEAAGVPANLMEVLTITLVFERRVINQYTRHRAAAHVDPHIIETIDLIMADEKWHVRWVRDALKALEDRYGAADIAATLERCRQADRDVHAVTLAELADRIPFLRGTP